MIPRMGRQPRASVEDLVYHAYNRGNNGDKVFSDASDREAFRDALGRTNERYPFELFGYCLMPDHFHLLLKPAPGQSISRIVQSLTVAQGAQYHRHHGTSGHVWQGRFKSHVIQEDAHLLAVMRYIEANPVRAGRANDLAACRWSSYQHHGMGEDDACLSPLPGWEELGRTESERRRRWRDKVTAAQKPAELEAVRASLRRGLPFGDPDWLTTVASRLNINPNPRPPGRPRKQSL
jgi:putative transposase